MQTIYRKFSNKIAYIFLFILLTIIYFPWFDLHKTLSAGDWPYLYKENILAFKIFPQGSFLWLEPYYNLTAKIGAQLLSLKWEIIEKLFWFYPFLIIGAFSSWIFIKFILEKINISRFKECLIFIGCLIFIANTYVLMIVGGGQMGVGLAYAFSPLVLYSYFRIFENKIAAKNILLFSLISAAQLMFDPRLFLITLSLVFMHLIFDSFIEKKLNKPVIKRMIFINVLSIIINLFWIIPNLSDFGSKYLQAAAQANANFLSFATFSNSISLLHPNWPENIFGEIGFMKPEFIFVPIIAYSSLLFFNMKDQKRKSPILFFALIGLFGAFLSKGTGEPFGQIYLFLSNLPGGSIFRDPTKFYLWISLSYSILIPVGTYFLAMAILKNRNKLQAAFLLLIILYLIFLIKPAIAQSLTGTFSPQAVPAEYIGLKNFLVNQKGFSSVLWIPKRQRFGFSSDNHPFVNAEDIFSDKTFESLVNELYKDKTKQLLESSNIKYVVIPYDSKKEIFIENRTYDGSMRIFAIAKLAKVKWLKKVEANFGQIIVFKIGEN